MKKAIRKNLKKAAIEQINQMLLDHTHSDLKFPHQDTNTNSETLRKFLTYCKMNGIVLSPVTELSLCKAFLFPTVHQKDKIPTPQASNRKHQQYSENELSFSDRY